MISFSHIGNREVIRYRVADIDCFPAGKNHVLIYSKKTQNTKIVSTDTAKLLTQCADFKSLDEHINNHFEGLQPGHAVRTKLQTELKSLIESGHLLSVETVLSQLQTPNETSGKKSIATLCIPTCNRVESLDRCLTGYIENFQSQSRAIKAVVFDDSETKEMRNAYRELLRTIGTRYHIQVEYAGLEEKTAFKAKLLEYSNVPEDVIDFAFISQHQFGLTTIGANRNAILLHTIGEHILCVDDDTNCRLALAPHAQPGIAFAQQGNPIDASFYPNREVATRAVSFVEQDILKLHETWLGRNPLELTIYNQNIELGTLDMQFLSRLTSRPRKVSVTLQGTLGDCSWDNQYFYLFQTGETFARMVSSEKTYKMSRATREVAQAATRTTIADSASPMFAMCMGLDNTELLPPFAPFGRAEEITFASLLSHCFRDSLAVYLPWTVLHLPLENRTFPEYQPFVINFGGWLASCFDMFDLGYASSPPARLKGLGIHLQDFANISPKRFEDFVQIHMWQTMTSLIESLEVHLQTDDSLPDFYIYDVENYIKLLRKSALVPLNSLYGYKNGISTLQKQVLHFGRLLTYWSDLIDAAKYLKQQGINLAQTP